MPYGPSCQLSYWKNCLLYSRLHWCLVKKLSNGIELGLYLLPSPFFEVPLQVVVYDSLLCQLMQQGLYEKHTSS